MILQPSPFYNSLLSLQYATKENLLWKKFENYNRPYKQECLFSTQQLKSMTAKRAIKL